VIPSRRERSVTLKRLPNASESIMAIGQTGLIRRFDYGRASAKRSNYAAVRTLVRHHQFFEKFKA